MKYDRIIKISVKECELFWTFELKAYGVSTGHARPTHAQRTYNK